MKKRVMLVVMLLIIYLYLINISLLFSDQFPRLTGAGITTATVSLIITSPNSTITIYSPLNQTYNFGIGDNYTLDLNVSADFIVSSWSYTLIDMRHDVTVNNSIGFSPNTTFDAVRWNNRLIVFAVKNGTGETINATVDFYINVPNSAPYFGPINSSIFICENDFLSHYFNVTDHDEEVLQLSLNPTNPFYLDTIFTSSSVQTSLIELFSGALSEADSTDGGDGWQFYEETIEVTDNYNATCCSDTAYTNITTIRVNDAPIMQTIGVQTIHTVGDNSSLFKQVIVNDEEDGNSNSSDINFNISFSNETLFNITDNGIMNFTPNVSQIGVYNVTVCTNDTGIDNAYANISICNQTGESITFCETFGLTVTDENRAPTIIEYFPENLTFVASSLNRIYFNITKYDPDGTIPDTYWYVDDVFREYDSGNSTDEFFYTPGCDVGGVKRIKAEITDGLLNDSIEWNVTLSFVACPLPEGGGGGGGGALPSCLPKWVVGTWNVCQNAERSLEVGLLSGEDYRNIIMECNSIELKEDSCGFQSRNILDLNFCNNSYQKPAEIQSCHYTSRPSCRDKIKNCHDGACELLVDCGGPCEACPSCSDKIKNQGEGGIDCGGPCPWRCEKEQPFYIKYKIYWIWLLLILLIILIIITIRKIRQILKHKRMLGTN